MSSGARVRAVSQTRNWFLRIVSARRVLVESADSARQQLAGRRLSLAADETGTIPRPGCLAGRIRRPNDVSSVVSAARAEKFGYWWTIWNMMHNQKIAEVAVEVPVAVPALSPVRRSTRSESRGVGTGGYETSEPELAHCIIIVFLLQVSPSDLQCRPRASTRHVPETKPTCSGYFFPILAEPTGQHGRQSVHLDRKQNRCAGTPCCESLISSPSTPISRYDGWVGFQGQILVQPVC